MKKKSVFLLIILIIALGMTAKVEATEKVDFSGSLTTTSINPVYKNEDIQKPATKVLKSAKRAAVKNSGSDEQVEQKKTIDDLTPEERAELFAYLDQNYPTNKTTIAIRMRNNMVNRATTFTVNAKATFDHELKAKEDGSPDEDFDAYVANLINLATGEDIATTSSTGDYLKWSWNEYNTSAQYINKEENGQYVYYMDLTFTLDYYTTLEQENKLNSDIQTYISKNIDKKYDTTYERACKIYLYLCNNVTYDKEHESDATYMLKYSAYAAMENKTAVCQGYATLYYKMLKEAGVANVRVMTSTTHGWNIVKIGNTYYHVDATWGSDDSINNPAVFFLRGDDVIEPLSEHQKEEEYKTTAFQKKYPISTTDYQLELSQCHISGINASYTYTGKTIVPALKVTCLGYPFVAGTDYKVTWKNNKVQGIATAEITGVNSLTGKVTKTFKILPAKTTGVKTSKNATNSLRLSWTKQAGVTGYRVYKYNTKTKKYDYVSGSQTSNTYVDIKKLSTGTAYSFKVRAYKTTNQGELFGDYSAVVTTATTPSKVTIKAPTAGKKKLTAKWKKVSPATGYVVEYSTNNKFKASATKKVTVTKNSTLSKTIKNLKKKKKYYVRICAYKEVNKTKYYGTYSSVKSIKTK